MLYNTPLENNETKVGNNPLKTAKCHFLRLLCHTMENHNRTGLICWPLYQCLNAAHSFVRNYNPDSTIGGL